MKSSFWSGQWLPLLLLGLVALAFVSPANGTQSLSEADRARALKLYKQQPNGSYGSLEETYKAVEALSLLKASPDAAKTCAYLKGVQLGEPQPSYYVLKAAAALTCSEMPKLQGAVKALSAVLGSESSTLLDLYHASGALAAASNQGGKVDSSAVAKALERLRGLASEGSWKLAGGDEEGSTYGAGLAFQTAANLVKLGGSLSNQQASTLVRGVLTLFGDLGSSGAQPALDDDGEASAVHTTGTILRGVVSLAEATKNPFDIKEKLPGLADFLLSSKDTSSASEMHSLLDGLDALSLNIISVPVVLSVTPSVLSASGKSTLKVVATTPLGTEAVPSTVVLTRATRANKKKPLILNKAIEGDQLDLVESIKEPGFYDLTFEVVPDDQAKYRSGGPVKEQIKVTSEAKLADATLTILEGDKEATRTSLTSKPLESKLYASHLQKLRLAFKLTTPLGAAFSPQQALVRLEHTSGTSHVFVTKRDGSSFSFQLELLDNMDKFYYLSGDYTVKLQVGDATMENPIDWTVGVIEITFPTAPAGAPTPPAQGGGISSEWEPLPEIQHIFRPKEKLPPATVSLLFTVLSLAPLLGLLAGFAALGVNSRGFPSTGLAFLNAVAFHACIFAIAVLYLLYWLKLNLFQTLGGLVVLGIITLVPGHFTLSTLADSKVKTA